MALLLPLCANLWAQAPLPVQVAEVVLRPFEDRTEALGTLFANESVVLSVNVTETITAIHFEDGQAVKAGAVLVEMTSEEEHALLEEAKTNADEALRQLTRIKQLVASGTASESLLDQRQRDYDAAHARLVATQSRLSDRIVLAPFDGVLGLRNVSVGTLVRPGDVITTLTDSRNMKLDFKLPSLFLASVAVGLNIVARADAYPQLSFEGTISAIDNQVDPVTRAITVRARLPNDTGKLKQGMLMKVEVLMNAREALVVPESALLPVAEKNHVMLVKSGEQGLFVERREVRIGKRRFGEVEVLSGLQRGDRVVTDGAFKLAPGAAIVVAEALTADVGTP